MPSFSSGTQNNFLVSEQREPSENRVESRSKGLLSSKVLELTAYDLRETPSETTPEIYDVCNETDPGVLFVHLRRAGGATLNQFLVQGVGFEHCGRSSVVN